MLAAATRWDFGVKPSECVSQKACKMVILSATDEAFEQSYSMRFKLQEKHKEKSKHQEVNGLLAVSRQWDILVFPVTVTFLRSLLQLKKDQLNIEGSEELTNCYSHAREDYVPSQERASWGQLRLKQHSCDIMGTVGGGEFRFHYKLLSNSTHMFTKESLKWDKDSLGNFR
uniref:COMM domain-containing protein n=1 Tax=Steinernema glaseri TaxID=37863 RepID=A0A1I7ZF20_9BILA